MHDDILNHLRTTFPDIPKRALDFFSHERAFARIKPSSGSKHPPLPLSSAADFAATMKRGESGSVPPFQALRLVLDRLVDAGLMIKQGDQRDTIFGSDTLYLYMKNEGRDPLERIAEFIAYGYPAVLDAYGPLVRQIVVYENDDQKSGTAFPVGTDLLLTAAHCVSTAPRLSVSGLSVSDLAGARILSDPTTSNDCACIKLREPQFTASSLPMWERPTPLREVVLIGYPNIPTLVGSQVAERANVGTVLRGAVAGTARDIFKTDLLLLTAPARGGFSGGPVVTDWGLVVGMISRSPDAHPSEFQRYDPSGFSLAIPSSTVQTFVEAIEANERDRFVERDPQTYEWVDPIG